MVELFNELGEEIEEIELPSIFSQRIREDLIKKAVLSSQSKRRQKYGVDKKSGKRTTAESWGAGRGAAMVPRIKDGRRAAVVPQAVGGRKGHPPKSKKDFEKSINKKERKLAIKGAISATSDPEIVKKRGHKFEIAPIIVKDSINEIKKTKEIKNFLEIAGAYKDIKRSKNKRKKTKNGYRTPKSILFVIKEDNGIKKAARNLPGTDIILAKNLNVEALAPGTVPGRLTIYTESSIEQIEEVFQ